MSETKYKQFGRMSFDERTPDEVCKLLESLSHSNRRVNIRTGDLETGRDWNEECDTVGTIGCSTGTYKIPLLINNRRSKGGRGILDHCILKVMDAKTKQILYRHPMYQERTIEIRPLKPEDIEPKYPELTIGTYINGKLHGRHKTEQSAKICKTRLGG